MYLHLMKEKVKSDAYPSLDALDKDMQVMFQNCVTFNGEGSYFAQYAIGLKKDWEGKHKQLKSLLAPTIADPAKATKSTDKHTKKSSTTPTETSVSHHHRDSAVDSSVDTDINLGLLLLEEWHWVTSMDCLELFANEVDIVGYSDYVKHPMDLGTMKEKVINGEYHSPEDFHKDMNLMFENCVVFNGKESEVGLVSVLVFDEFVLIFSL
jgi:hypothetical protein